MKTNKKNQTNKALAIPLTRDACDACSQSSEFLDVLLKQTVNSAPPWLVAEEQISQYAVAAGRALIGIQPNGELEGMLAAQLIACHNAAMECYRRAMNSQLPARDYHLNQANKLSRTYSTLLDSLNKHRGKGQQRVTVEHVHVHQGGQAIVGHVEPGGGGATKSKEQPHAKQIAHAPQPSVWGPNETGDSVPVTSDAERPVSDA